MHTKFAFQPGDDQDPRHPDGNVIYDDGVTLDETDQAARRNSMGLRFVTARPGCQRNMPAPCA